MNGLPHSDYAREEALRLRVDQAIAELRRAHVQRDDLLAAVEGEANTADGAFAVQRAMRIQREALRKLREALAEFEAFRNGPHG